MENVLFLSFIALFLLVVLLFLALINFCLKYHPYKLYSDLQVWKLFWLQESEKKVHFESICLCGRLEYVYFTVLNISIMKLCCTKLCTARNLIHIYPFLLRMWKTVYSSCACGNASWNVIILAKVFPMGNLVLFLKVWSVWAQQKCWTYFQVFTLMRCTGFLAQCMGILL